MTMINMTIMQRVEKLREWMRLRGFDAFVIPTADPHNSEYLPEHWKAREWITGFTGSAGLAVVTLHKAALWTDSRYFLQAEEQLAGSPFVLMKEGVEGTLEPEVWLYEEAQAKVIGYSAEMMPGELFDKFNDYFCQCDEEIEFSYDLEDPFDVIWTDRPALPCNEVTLFPENIAGCSVKDKIMMLRGLVSIVTDLGDNVSYFFNDPTEIAWLLNIRGSDIEHTPVPLCYLLLDSTKNVLFVDPDKVRADVKEHLKKYDIKIAKYGEWRKELKKLGNIRYKRLIVPPSLSTDIYSFLEVNNVNFEECTSPIIALRARKSENEKAGMRSAMERDGVAMVQFLRWLDENVGKKELTEIDVDQQLTSLRAQQKGYLMLSFGTIAAYGAHGAIVHYEATAETAIKLQPRGLLLLDSGAHYDSGTTDITRTIALGETTAEERKVYTLVLKGHIALAKMKFPSGITALQLDTAARYAMWQHGYDFGHGTGHGVGCCLSVHEGPVQIRKNKRDDTVLPFSYDQTITNEPGIYIEGKFGVRIENVMLSKSLEANHFGDFLGFEQITLCPYDLRPVDFSMLNADEVEWINNYHAMVRERLLPLLTDPADVAWLQKATAPVGQEGQLL